MRYQHNRHESFASKVNNAATLKRFIQFFYHYSKYLSGICTAAASFTFSELPLLLTATAAANTNATKLILVLCTDYYFRVTAYEFLTSLNNIR